MNTHRFTIEVIEGVNNVALYGQSGVYLWSGPLEDLESILRRHQEMPDPLPSEWEDISVLEPITRELAPAPDLGDLDMGDGEER